MLADSETKYIYRQQIYIGKNPGGKPEVGLVTKVVKSLCEGLEGKGHHLYTDNYYTNVDLYSFLFENKIYACGTIKTRSRNFPKEIVIHNTKGLARGTTQWRMSGPLLSVAWVDSKPVYFLSTIHPPEFSQQTPVHGQVVKHRGAGEGGQMGDVACPPLLKDNKYMGGVDQGDQMLKYYSCFHKTVKWYRKVLFLEVEVTIHNAFVIECDKREGSERGGRSALDFRIELAESLFGGMHKECHASIGPCNECLRLQDVGQHVPNMLSTKGNCAVCSKKIRKAHKINI